MTGAAVFALSLNFRLGIAATASGGRVCRHESDVRVGQARNMKSLQSLGRMSSEIQESLQNFR